MRFILAALLLAPGVASAHARLQNAVPAAGSTVLHAPAELTLSYSEGIEPSFSKVAVNDAAGTRMDQGTPHVDPQNNAHLLVPVKPLPRGTYKVVWHAVSVDAHKSQGSYSFTVTGP
jgi:methionine-rich copper-binding protein CopC